MRRSDIHALVGDIGGTNARFAVMALDAGLIPHGEEIMAVLRVLGEIIVAVLAVKGVAAVAALGSALAVLKAGA